MTAPFRDLFVELPRAVLETLQGAIEAEVRRLQPAPLLRRPRIVDVLNTPQVIAGACDRFGLRGFSVCRAENTEEAILRMVPRCGHERSVRVSEQHLEDTRDLAGLLAKLIEHGMRRKRCLCVGRPT